MWAVRLGVPPLWPSRIKVVITTFVAGSFLLKLSSSLSNAITDLDSVDMDNPSTKEVSCNLPAYPCDQLFNVSVNDILDCLCDNGYCPTYFHFSNFTGKRSSYVMLKHALGYELPVHDQEFPCDRVPIPVQASHRGLWRISKEAGFVGHILNWHHVFLFQFVCLCTNILIHDLSLLQKDVRPRILSLRAVKEYFPLFWSLQRLLRCAGLLHRVHEMSLILWLLFLPVFTAWQVLMFLVIIYPCLGLMWLRHPVQLSRVCVFFNAGYCSIVLLFAVLRLALWRSGVLHDDTYTLFWGRWETHLHPPPDMPNYICHCSWHLSSSLRMELIQELGVAFIGTLSMMLRALKGLRHSRWANLFSVFYTIPIEAYPVEWERPGGGTVQHRNGKGVQCEPAFDAFCLMDEQPESWRSRPQISVIRDPVDIARAGAWHQFEVQPGAEVQCCGFPSFKERPLCCDDGTSDCEDSSDDGDDHVEERSR